MKLNKQKILEAGKILSQVRDYAKKIAKKGVLLVEIADKMEEKMAELGGKPAFPTCLSINEIAAHYTPSHDDKETAKGLLKIDFGVHVDGWIADSAFSIDFENSEENRKLIKASEDSLESAIKTIRESVKIREVGKAINEKISSYGFSPIINLFGHSVEHWALHAGISIPNFDNGDNEKIKNGLYAIEPFATSGNGKVYDGKPSGIYIISEEKNVRSQTAREVLQFIKKEYKTLPFCSRWIVKHLGAKAMIGMKQLEENGNIYSYPSLVESSRKNVAQSEHTMIVEGNNVIVTTR